MSPSTKSQTVAFVCVSLLGMAKFLSHLLSDTSLAGQTWNWPADTDAPLPVSESTIVEWVTFTFVSAAFGEIVTANSAQRLSRIFHGDAGGSIDHEMPGFDPPVGSAARQAGTRRTRTKRSRSILSEICACLHLQVNPVDFIFLDLSVSRVLTFDLSRQEAVRDYFKTNLGLFHFDHPYMKGIMPPS